MELSITMQNMGYGNGTVPNNGKNGKRKWNCLEQCKTWDTGMERYRTKEKMGYGNERVQNNGKYGIREWKGPEQWKIWNTGMENMEIGNGTAPSN